MGRLPATGAVSEVVSAVVSEDGADWESAWLADAGACARTQIGRAHV